LSKSIQKLSTQIISFPKDATRKQGAKAGRYVLDFENGLVTAPDGSTEEMSNDLKKIGSNFARSVFVTVSTVETKIKIGQNQLPQTHQLTYVVQGIGFQDMVVEFPVDRIPLDDFSFAVMASDSNIFPVDADVLVGFHNPTPQTGNTGAAYVTVFDFVFTGYSQIEIITENTGGVNTIFMKIQVSEDGVNWVDHQGYEKSIAINDNDVFSSSVKHKYYRVQVKNNSGSSTFRVQTNLER